MTTAAAMDQQQHRVRGPHLAEQPEIPELLRIRAIGDVHPARDLGPCQQVFVSQDGGESAARAKADSSRAEARRQAHTWLALR